VAAAALTAWSSRFAAMPIDETRDRAPAVRPDPRRVLDDLAELRNLTATPRGADRLAWTEGWARARAFLAERLAEIGVESERDEAGNVWATVDGVDRDMVAVGSHLDAVPEGGWLDGALGVFAGLELLRAVAASGRPPRRRLALIDFADEEGARFGRSLLGSSAVAGRLDPSRVADLRDAAGVRLEDALAGHGIDLDRAPSASARARGLTAYLELHIEQGPILEAEGVSVAAVRGAMGISRHRWTITGRTGHAGSTPAALRRDPMVAAAQAIVGLRALASGDEERATVGQIEAVPGIPTAIPERVEFTVDLRHESAVELARLEREFADVVRRAAEQQGCASGAEEIFAVSPTRFDPRLLELAGEVCAAHAGRRLEVVSGPGHDAVELAHVVPAAMLFAPSIGGVSHSREEDTAAADLTIAIAAFFDFALAVLEAFDNLPIDR
jgi:hydantoinase/carbamoylase family amidase